MNLALKKLVLRGKRHKDVYKVDTRGPKKVMLKCLSAKDDDQSYYMRG